MAFLELCKMNFNDVNELESFAPGIFLTENYAMSNLRKKEALLIEGIHQYSSLIAESLFGKSSSNIFIPVMIKSMDISNQVNLKDTILRGEVISSDEFLHIRTVQIVADRISGSSDVFLKRIPLNNHDILPNIFSYGVDLFHVLRIKNLNDELLLNFKLNEFHHIFKDHFRGYPVCPASLIIEFISDIILNYGMNSAFKIINTKFLHPLVPCKEYELHIHISELTASFIISDLNQVRFSAGKLIYQRKENKLNSVKIEDLI